MERGEIWWVNFDRSVGGEIRKKRPAVIVSNNAANKYLNRIQVVPLSSSVQRIYPSEAPVTFSGKNVKAMADQISTVSKIRLTRRAGAMSRNDMEKIEDVIKIQLGLRL